MSVETVSLESMCELVVDCPHSTPKWTDSGVVVLRNQNIRNGELDLSSPSYTDEKGYRSRIKRAVPQPGDIVFTREAPMGEVCVIPEGVKCCLGQRQVLLRPRTSVHGAYLYWALQSPFVKHQISWNEGTGTTVSNVRIPVLKALQIPRRGHEEPIIASVLNSLVKKIRINQKINQTLEQMAQAIFKSWFVDFEPVKAKIAAREAGGSEDDALLTAMRAISGTSLFDADASAAGAEAELARLQAEQPEQYAELRATAELFPSAMQDSELGQIPEGWTPTKLERHIELAYGKALKKDARVEGKYRVYGSGGVTGSHHEFLVPGPGIIVGRKGTVGSIYWEPDNFYPIDTTFYVTVKNGYSLAFAYYLLQTLGLSSMNTDAAVPGLNRNNVYRLQVPSFPTALVGQFSQIVASISEKISALNAESRTLTELRDSLLPKLLSGELSVSDAEDHLAEAAEATNV